MNLRLVSLLFFIVFAAVLFSGSFSGPLSAYAGGGHDHGHGNGHEEEEEEKGPHGGRLLKDGDFAVEITIFEKDVPPQFRVYAFEKKVRIKPAALKAVITLNRYGGEKVVYELSPEQDYLTSPKVVEEPHSFDVEVRVVHGEKTFDWHYESYEGRTELSEAALKVAKLEFEEAGPRKIFNDLVVYGRLLANENKVSHVVPRFPGLLKDIRKDLGDKVQKGDVLAVVESNQSLQPYEIKAHIDGVVIKRDASLGEFVSDTRELFIVVDLSEIWADFQVYRDEFEPIKTGQKITVDLGKGEQIAATVRYISPVTDEVTQSKLVRAVLPNPSATLRPGLFVTGIISSSETEVPIAVKREAIQTFRDWDVVYLTDGHVFQAMPVELGRRDSKYVEVLSGINTGSRYVSKNSFIVKADIEKAGASHDH